MRWRRRESIGISFSLRRRRIRYLSLFLISALLCGVERMLVSRLTILRSIMWWCLMYCIIQARLFVLCSVIRYRLLTASNGRWRRRLRYLLLSGTMAGSVLRLTGNGPILSFAVMIRTTLAGRKKGQSLSFAVMIRSTLAARQCIRIINTRMLTRARLLLLLWCPRRKNLLTTSRGDSLPITHIFILYLLLFCR